MNRRINRTLHSTLQALEQRMLDPEVRRDRAAVKRLLAEEFEEIGKSGRRYDRAAMLDLLASEATPAEAVMEEFQVTALGSESAFVTYSSGADGSTAYRSSVWIYRESRWQMLHHQGTLAAAE